MNNINYLIFNSYLQAFADAHYQVMRYGSDFVDQLQNFGSSGTTYPLLYCAPATYNFRPNKFTGSRLNELTVNIYCIDLLLDDRSNVNPILNTTSCILNDLFKWLTEAQLPGVDLLSVSPLRPLNNYTMESCAGWVMTATLQLESYGVCDIPFEFPPVLPVTTGGGGNGGGGCTWDGFSNYSVIYGINGYPQSPNQLPSSWQAIQNYNKVITCNGNWTFNGPSEASNQVIYNDTGARTFNVTVLVAMSTQNPGLLEYSWLKSQGGPPRSFESTTQAMGTTPGGNQPHAAVTFTDTWTPSVPGDFYTVTTRQQQFSGPTPQTPTLWTFQVNISE